MDAHAYARTTLAELRDQRRKQTADLAGPIFDPLEERIELDGATCLSIRGNGDEIGYAIVDERDPAAATLLEFYVDPLLRKDAGRILDTTLAEFRCARWLVNSQDSFALPLFLERGFPYEVEAYLFSAATESREPPLRDGMAVVGATPADLERTYALIMQDGFYTGDGRVGLAARIGNGEIFLLRDRSELRGVGFVCPLERTPRYADIAMIIDGAHRGQGLAHRLVTRLVRISRDRGLLPTALTSKENLASRRTLEKCGFYLDGCVLRATTRAAPR